MSHLMWNDNDVSEQNSDPVIQAKEKFCYSSASSLYVCMYVYQSEKW